MSATAAPARRRAVVPVLALIAAAAAAAHAVLQGVGAATHWRPCVVDGYGSDVCLFLQYEAPAPGWHAMLALWPITAGLVAVAAIAALVARRARWLAWGALGAALLANPITDYVMTPAVNGGYTSADDSPGFGVFGAVALGVAAVLLVLLALRRPAR